MEIRQLQIFVSAAHTLNFTKAAMKLGYTQSNITSQIHGLEKELGVKLFERFGKSLRLTSEGTYFLKNAENILHQCSKAKEELSPDVFSGILNIGAAETLCVNRLPKILLEYRKRYPRIEIRIQTESCNQLLGLLRDNRIDVALALTDKIDQPDMNVKVLYDEVMTVVASPLDPLAEKKTIVPADFANECLILTHEGCGYRPVILATLEACRVKPHTIMELSSIGAIKECTACGLGIAILPKIAVHDDLQRKKLIELAWQGPSILIKTQLIYHRDKWLSPAIKVFIELCSAMKH